MNARRHSLLVALFPVALVLASCGTDKPAPLAPAAVEDTTRSMLVIDGEPHVSVLLDGSLTEATNDGAVSGSFRAIVEDSSGFRTFLPRVRMNGAALVDQTDPLGNPAQSTIDVATALPGLRLADSLRFAVEDGGDVTPPFTLRCCARPAGLCRCATCRCCSSGRTPRSHRRASSRCRRR